MQAGEKKKTWDSSCYSIKTFWPRNHPVMFPHLHTDHWSKMKTMVPVYLSSLPAALLKEAVYEPHKGKPTQNCTTGGPLPPLTESAALVPSMLRAYSSPRTTYSPQNMPQYRNMFNDRARRGFCYWLVERKGPTCKGHSFGAYKTSLGLPKV